MIKKFLVKVYFFLKGLPEQLQYNFILKNGTSTIKQLKQNDNGTNDCFVSHLHFRRDGEFHINDANSAAHIFREIFIHKDYSLPFKTSNSIPMIIDVGANIGLFTYYMLKRFPNANLHAFEADPNNFDILTKNLSLFPYFLNRNIFINNQAISSANGFLDFYVSSYGGWSSRYDALGTKGLKPVKVPTIRLSEYLLKNNISNVDLLKIDIEGGEYDIIYNDSQLWKFNIANLIIEIDREPRAGNLYTYNRAIEILRKNFNQVNLVKDGKYPVFHCSK